MQAGNMRHRLTVQTAVETQDQTTGELVRSWTTVATVWANILPMKGRELMSAAGTPLAACDTRIKLRWAPALANLGPKSRVAHLLPDGRVDAYYDIVSVTEPGLRKRELELMCVSGLSDG